MPQIVIATKHQKGHLIAPLLAPLGYEVDETDAFDTDSLGTFSGEIARTCTPEQAAYIKAKQACQNSDAEFGLGSEGSFTSGPYFGLMTHNTEILCLYQRSTNTAIYAQASGAFAPRGLTIDEHTTSGTVAQTCSQFKNQHWILSLPNALEKGLNLTQLQARLNHHKPLTGQITPDLRAMYSPQRQAMIVSAAKDLIRRLKTKCPECDTANFVIKKTLPGLLCAQCTLPTKQIKTYISHCDHCQFSVSEPSKHTEGDPTYCQLCNP